MSRPDAASPTLLHVLAPGEVGGLESVVQALAIGQRRTGINVTVVSVVGHEEHPPVLHRVLQTAGVEVVTIALPPRAYLRERRALGTLFVARNPEIVHTHGYRADVVAGRVARGLGLATVTTVHGFTGGGWKNRLYERLQCAAFRRFNAVIAVSRPLVQRLVAAGVPAERIHCVPNAWGGVHDPLSRSDARAALGVPQDGYLVGWVGRLGREKGADVLLQALTYLGDLPLMVSFVGDGGEGNALREQTARLDLLSRVRWQGVVPEAARIYSAFDCFVLSSRTEGTPIALFEAMEAQVPVVATRVGGVPDIVGPSEALLVSSENPAELAGAVRALYEDRELGAGLTQRARDRLANQFGMAPWLERHLGLYRSILSPAGAARLS